MAELSIFPMRLKNARLMKGFSMEDLCAAMGNPISKMAISKYESGQLRPNSTILILLSKALDQPIDYFFRPFSVQIDSVRFQKKSRLSAKREHELQETLADYMERYLDIENICNEPTPPRALPNEPVKSKEDVKNIVTFIRHQWGFGTNGILNVLGLLEMQGVKILELNVPISFDGMSATINDIFYAIVLNKSLPAEKKRFTALHELGHLILNFDKKVSSQEEELCDLFASEMLLPEIELKRLLGNSRKSIAPPELLTIQAQYGIPYDVILQKAKDSQILTIAKYRALCHQLKQIDIFSSSQSAQEGANRFTRLVYKALSQELITLSKAANLLHAGVEQVQKEFLLA